MHGEVTNRVEPDEWRYSAATKVKGLSPEILVVVRADLVLDREGRTGMTVRGEDVQANRGPRPWRGITRFTQELGRPKMFLEEG